MCIERTARDLLRVLVPLLRDSKHRELLQSRHRRLVRFSVQLARSIQRRLQVRLGVFELLQVRERFGQRRVQLDSFVTVRPRALLEDGERAARSRFALVRIADQQIQVGQARQGQDPLTIIRISRVPLLLERGRCRFGSADRLDSFAIAPLA